MAAHDEDLATRLGIRPGTRLAIVNEPDGWLDRLHLPDGVTGYERASEPLDVIVYFSDERANVARRLPVFGGFLAPSATLWMATPEDAPDLTREDVESMGTGAGLVAADAVTIPPGWRAIAFRR
jgi:hypothetical protein